MLENAELARKEYFDEWGVTFLRCVQRPGEIMFLPAGGQHPTWHATYNLPAADPSDPLTIGFGGFGVGGHFTGALKEGLSSPALAAAVLDDVDGMRRLVAAARARRADNGGAFVDEDLGILAQAARHACSEALLRLIPRAALLLPNAQGLTPLLHVAGAGRVGAVRYLVDEIGMDVRHRNWQGRGAMHGAARAGSAATVRFLAARGAAVRGVSDEPGKFEPAHFAAGAGGAWAADTLRALGELYVQQQSAGDGNYSDVVSPLPLLEARSQSDGMRPVHFAVAGSGRTLPDRSADATGSAVAVLAFLQRVGADLEARTDSGKTPLDLVLERGDANCAAAKWLQENLGGGAGGGKDEL